MLPCPKHVSHETGLFRVTCLLRYKGATQMALPIIHAPAISLLRFACPIRSSFLTGLESTIGGESMVHKQPPGESPHRDSSAESRLGAVAAPIDQREIFRQLIEDEIRNGRLTRARRRRIVRYAAQLRLSAVEAGNMIERCRARLAEERELYGSAANPPQLKLAARPKLVHEPPYASIVWQLWLILVAALMFDLVMLRWLA